ncbi:MAG: TAXI family TRAP transporter solute-binding subunit [Alphaproteobacteria bacterium]|nr:TAXI family TRAP transporter solute-binding subunit [Alphaproteobacteria bacterium]
MKVLNKILVMGLMATALTGAAYAEKLKMATIAPGSSAYLVMTTMASMVNAAQDEYQISVDATGVATKHMVEAAQGKLDIVMGSPVIINFMQKGTAMYSKLPNAPELAKNLELLYWFPYGAYHTVVYDDSGINSLKDIKGKKVFLGPPGGGAWNVSKQWIEATTGYLPGEDYTSVKASWSSALQGFQDRQFDVFVTGGIPPFPQVEQLAATNDVKILGFSKQEVENATKEMLAPANKPGRVLEVIRPEDYGDGVTNEEDVYTVGSIVGVVARADLSEAAIYAVTKAFWDNLKSTYATAPYMRKVTIENALSAATMKLHPGALKYYREIGLNIPEGMGN